VGDTYFARLSHAPLGVQLNHLITGSWIAQAIRVAAELRIADLLADGPSSVCDLAAATGTHARTLSRLLRALASVGLFTHAEPDTFGRTPISDLLQADAPGSLREMVLWRCGDTQWSTWGQLQHSIRTGTPAFEQVHGVPLWEYFAQQPAVGATFHAAMTSSIAEIAAAVVATYDFSEFSTLVDVGGGRGGMLIAILRANPGLRGILFDLPQVVEGAKQAAGAAGLLERCDLVGGDMFEAVPRGGDAYVLSRLVHDWDDERSVAILKNCRRAAGPHTKVLVVETILPPGDTPSFGKLLDLQMLVDHGGQERTEAEYRALYEAARFRIARVIPTRSAVSVIEGVPL
jgi:hypothetical protein